MLYNKGCREHYDYATSTLRAAGTGALSLLFKTGLTILCQNEIQFREIMALFETLVRKPSVPRMASFDFLRLQNCCLVTPTQRFVVKEIGHFNGDYQLAAKYKTSGLRERINILERKHRDDPEYPFYWLQLISAYRENGQQKKAIKILEKRIQTGILEQNDLREPLMREYEEVEMYDAVMNLDRAITLLRLYVEVKIYDAAINLYRAIKCPPTQVIQLMIEVYLVIGNRKEAQCLAVQMIEGEQDWDLCNSPKAPSNIIRSVLQAFGEKRQVIEVFQAALSRYRRPEILYLIFQYHLSIDDVGTAKASLAEICRSPWMTRELKIVACYDMYEYYCGQQNESDIMKDDREVYKMVLHCPRKPSDWWHGRLGTIALFVGDYDVAITAFQDGTEARLADYQLWHGLWDD
jgi:tetratricopeptide (TPR) repeat protein